MLWRIGDRPRVGLIIRFLPVQVKGVMQGPNAKRDHHAARLHREPWDVSPLYRPKALLAVGAEFGDVEDVAVPKSVPEGSALLAGSALFWPDGSRNHEREERA